MLRRLLSLENSQSAMQCKGEQAMEQVDFGAGDNSIHLKVVSDATQLSHALIVRGICMFEEVGLTIHQTFDGNDYQCTHIVAHSGMEPIGASRIRWFRDFAKIERTCFRKAYRSARTLRQCCDFIFDRVARKGYSQLVTHAEPKIARVWQRILGFEEVEGRPIVKTEGQQPYVEMIKRLTVPANAISLDTEPKILFRVEGNWHVPSVFENV
jgi:hypothetical protein